MTLRFASRPGMLIGLLALAWLPGCGGGDDGPTNPVPQISTGVFLDGAVEGLEFAAGSKSGTTDAAGTFQFDSGSNVTFEIGDIVLGTGLATTVMTPVEIVPGAVDELDPTVTNITRFLLTVDDDATAANGIALTSAIREAASGQAVNFAQSTAAFETDPATLEAVDSLTSHSQAGERLLVDAATAQSHLEATRAEVLAASYSGVFHHLAHKGRSVLHDETGTWSFTVAADGTLTGTATIEGQTLSMNASMESSGSFLGANPEPPSYNFNGTIAIDGTVEGEWHGPGEIHGEMTGTRQ